GTFDHTLRIATLKSEISDAIQRYSMRTRSIARLLLSAALVSPVAALAQHEHGGAAGEQLGSVTFPVACNGSAQERMHRAVAMLHSFWFTEGRKAFEEVAEADPACGIAYWGIAMTHFGNPMAGGSTGQPQASGWRRRRKAPRSEQRATGIADTSTPQSRC